MPVVRQLAAATPRSRVVVASATVVSAATEDLLDGPCYTCVVDDGTGRVTLLFVGRREVPELPVGSRCRFEGTAQMLRGRLVVWNPVFRRDGSPPDIVSGGMA